ncbi:hypothetical protein AVEN_108407-1 [Araneus ventricosus]|uniref:Uncharacterized protein n=1 Tax=Araneus ventricosus TaxID=182803 RepID=A0A4Y2UBB4_ARAVE|nr:hypothetical protein AVEN_108407-1 [Araneus ventricosus]
MFQDHKLSLAILDILTNWVRLSESEGLSTYTTWILYGYHFAMDRKTFRTADQGRCKSRDTARELVEEYWEPDALSTTTRTTSFAVLFESHFRPLPCSTPNTPVSSNLVIIFLRACLDMGPFRNPFQASIFSQRSCQITAVLTSSTRARSFFSNIIL